MASKRKTPLLSQETPQEEIAILPSPPPLQVEAEELPSKADAIREAFSTLPGGVDAPTSSIQAFIKEKYGLEVAVANIYGLKNKMRGGGPSRKPPLLSSPSSPSLTLADIQALKSLGSRLGWDSLKDLVEELAAP